MSYILDALRRADAERDREAIPGLNTHTTSAEDSFMRVRPWWSQPWAWVGAGVCGGLLVAGLVSWLVAPDAPPAVAVVPPVPQPPPPSQPPQMTAPVPAAVPVQPVAQSPAAPVAMAPAAPAVPVYNAPPLESRKPPAAANSGNAAASGPSGQPGDAPRGAEPSAAATDNGRTYTLNELPDDVRRQLPALSIGGSSYSETPANRLLILNGQVFREGDRINADLVLEQIQLKSAVLRFKGYRYSVSY